MLLQNNTILMNIIHSSQPFPLSQGKSRQIFTQALRNDPVGRVGGTVQAEAKAIFESVTAWTPCSATTLDHIFQTFQDTVANSRSRMFLLTGKLLTDLHQQKDHFRVSVYSMAPLKSEVEKKTLLKSWSWDGWRQSLERPFCLLEGI